MRGLAVLAERFAVIRGHDDERAVERMCGLQAGEELTEHGVHIGDLGVVRGEIRARARRSVVGGVRIEEMHPRKPGAWRRENPVTGWRNDITRATLGRFECRTVFVTEPIIVFVEPAVEPEPPLEHKGADERTG